MVFPGNTGWHQELFRGRITPDDTAGPAALMSQLSDAQWDDAFLRRRLRSGGRSNDSKRRSKRGSRRRVAPAGRSAKAFG